MRSLRTPELVAKIIVRDVLHWVLGKSSSWTVFQMHESIQQFNERAVIAAKKVSKKKSSFSSTSNWDCVEIASTKAMFTIQHNNCTGTQFFKIYLLKNGETNSMGQYETPLKKVGWSPFFNPIDVTIATKFSRSSLSVRQWNLTMSLETHPNRLL